MAARPDVPRALPRNELWLDAAIAAVVFAAALGLLFASTDIEGPSEEVGAPAIVLTALATLPLVARRLAPLAVFVFTALASTALYAIVAPAGPPLGPTLALYWLAAGADGTRERGRWTLALVGVLLAAHVAASGVRMGSFPGAEILWGILVWGGAWLAGDRTRLRRERMAELEERALRAEREAERERRLAAAEERTRIARDLHDSAGHAINVILVHAALGRISSEADAEAARDAFATIEDVARETVGEIDQLVGALREDGAPADASGSIEPPAGLAALPALLDRHRAAGMAVEVSFDGAPRELPPNVDRAAYRILQEALTNAARHGGGGARVVVAFAPDAVELTIANELAAGRGAGLGGGGHGVVGMRERAALLGGRLEAGELDGRFRVHARLPLVEDHG